MLIPNPNAKPNTNPYRTVTVTQTHKGKFWKVKKSKKKEKKSPR